MCYDRRNEYMLISLNGTFYHYCEIDAGTVSSLLSAPSMGRFYNASIKGQFDCRITFAGSSVTTPPGNSTQGAGTSSFYDRNGRFSGSAIRNSDGTTSFYDSHGHFTGSVINTTPRR
jgi:KTSC domain